LARFFYIKIAAVFWQNQKNTGVLRFGFPGVLFRNPEAVGNPNQNPEAVGNPNQNPEAVGNPNQNPEAVGNPNQNPEAVGNPNQNPEAVGNPNQRFSSGREPESAVPGNPNLKGFPTAVPQSEGEPQRGRLGVPQVFLGFPGGFFALGQVFSGEHCGTP
jgi:hypothetical protein